MVQERLQMPQKNAEESCAEDLYKYHDGLWSHFYEWRCGGGGGGGMAGGLSVPMCPYTKTLRKNGTPQTQHEFANV